MLPEILDISRGCFLSVTDSLLRIIGRIAESFIVVKLQKIALFYYITNIQHIQHLNSENLTKNKSLSRLCRALAIFQVLNSRDHPSFLTARILPNRSIWDKITFGSVGHYHFWMRPHRPVRNLRLIFPFSCDIPSLTVARQRKPAERYAITHSGFWSFEKMLYVNVTSNIFSASGSVPWGGSGDDPKPCQST